MNKTELESFALQLLDRVCRGVKVEDSQVELKREWMRDYARIARRLAGLCNAVRGDSVVWLVGRGEDGSPAEEPDQEAHMWFAQVERHFDGVAPRMIQDARFVHEGSPATAMLFDARQRPYVCKVASNGPNAGSARLEVPWREGTAVRSARREDLIRMLYPPARVPTFEVIGGFVQYRLQQASGSAPLYWTGQLRLYIFPDRRAETIIPAHRMRCTIRGLSGSPEVPCAISAGSEFDAAPDPFVSMSTSTILANGPGQLLLHVHSESDVRPPAEPEDMQLEWRFSMIGDPREFVQQIRFERGSAERAWWDAPRLFAFTPTSDATTPAP